MVKLHGFFDDDTNNGAADSSSASKEDLKDAIEDVEEKSEKRFDEFEGKLLEKLI